MSVFLVLVLYVTLSGLFLSAWLPWWSFVPVGAIVAIFRAQSGLQALVAGFLAAFLPCLATTAYLDTLSDGRLTQRVASIFGLESALTLMLITASVNGLLGAWGTWMGWLFKWSLRSNRR